MDHQTWIPSEFLEFSNAFEIVAKHRKDLLPDNEYEAIKAISNLLTNSKDCKKAWEAIKLSGIKTDRRFYELLKGLYKQARRKEKPKDIYELDSLISKKAKELSSLIQGHLLDYLLVAEKSGFSLYEADKKILFNKDALNKAVTNENMKYSMVLDRLSSEAKKLSKTYEQPQINPTSPVNIFIKNLADAFQGETGVVSVASVWRITLIIFDKPDLKRSTVKNIISRERK